MSTPFNYCTLIDSIQAHFKTMELTKIQRICNNCFK